MARGLGFEPRYTASKAVVLPLDDPRIGKLWRYHTVQRAARQSMFTSVQVMDSQAKWERRMTKNPVLLTMIGTCFGILIGGIVGRLVTAHKLAPVEIPESVQQKTSVSVIATTQPPTLYTPPASTSATQTTATTQYVVLAFDGSRSIDMWQQTRAFSQEMKAAGSPVRFTYFINAVYLLAERHRHVYHPPQHSTGTSPIGFAGSERDVADRLEQMNAALEDGHEIGCHLTGHFNGSSWNEAEWQQEFQSFFHIIQQATTLNHLENEPPQRRALNMAPTGFIGFRAPELGVNEHLWPVLRQHGFQYDTSLTDQLGKWPSKRAHGLWEFPLTKIPFAGSPTSSLLSMDYNFYYKQSKAKDVAARDTPAWNEYYQQVLTSYRNYFEHSYHGNRAPLFIGHHFSLWNDGVYWEAMKAFAREVCGKQEVKCVSYKEVMDELNVREQTDRPQMPAQGSR